MLERVIKQFLESAPKVNVGVFWVETRPSSKFCGNQFSSFRVILLTNQPTNQNGTQ